MVVTRSDRRIRGLLLRLCAGVVELMEAVLYLVHCGDTGRAAVDADTIRRTYERDREVTDDIERLVMSVAPAPVRHQVDRSLIVVLTLRPSRLEVRPSLATRLSVHGLQTRAARDECCRYADSSRDRRRRDDRDIGHTNDPTRSTGS